MLEIKKFVFNPFQVNTYLLYDESRECIIIDAGCCNKEEGDRLISYIESEGLKPIKVISTHCHIDHIFYNNYLLKQYGILCYSHREEKIVFDGAMACANSFGFNIDTDYKMNYIEEGDVIKFGNTTIEIIHTPGHTSGGICLLERRQGLLFSGDTLFRGSIGRTDLPTGDYDTLIDSIKNKIFVLEENIKIFPGHGDSTSVKEEITSNPFFN